MPSELVLPSTTSKPFAAIRGIRTALLSALALTAFACGGGDGDGGGGGDLTPDAGMDDQPDGGTTCPTGYTGPTCTDCDAEYQDVDGDGVCNPSCEATGELALECGDHGTCQLDQQGERICSCDEGYQGAACDKCAPGYVMGASGCELYTPSSTNLVLWLDAQEQTTTMIGDPGVYTWADRRGGGSALQAVSSGDARPQRVQNGLNGRTILRFDGNDNMTIANFPGLKGNDYTVFVVLKPNGSSAGTVLALQHAEFGTMYSLRRMSSTTYRFSHRGTPAAGDGDFAQITFAAAETNTTKLLLTQRKSTPPFIWVLLSGNKGGELGGITGMDEPSEPNLSSTLSLRIGAGSLSGDLAEVLVYDRAVVQNEAKDIQAYLAAKWGIQ